MVEAISALDNPDLHRRATAITVAVVVNALFLYLIVALPGAPLRPERIASIDLVFFAPEPRAEPEPAPVPEERVIEPEQPAVDIAVEQTPETTPAPIEDLTTPLATVENPVEAETEDEVSGSARAEAIPEFQGDRLALPTGPGSTSAAMRSIFCMSTSDSNRNAFDCPPPNDSAGLPMVQYASEENRARAQAAFNILSDAQLRLLMSGRPLPTRDLGGTATMTNQHSQPTSSADQMRDSLPPLIPDPAFGD